MNKQNYESLIMILFIGLIGFFSTFLFPFKIRLALIIIMLVFIALIILKIIYGDRLDFVKIKKIIYDWHLRLCAVILMLSSIFIFIMGIAPSNIYQQIPSLVYLIIGWSGLIVSIKISKLFYK